MTQDAGFREIDHTADWSLELWAPDLPELFRQAAAGMYELCGVRFGSELRATRRFEFEGSDREKSLVQFLSELLYVLHAEHLAFREIEVEVGPEALTVDAVGDPVAAIDKEIKAVTWHDLSVRETDDGWRGRVTFDV